MIAGKFAAGACAVLWLALAFNRCDASAQSDSPAALRLLVRQVWRVAVNEGCLANLRDCSLVWQVVQGQAPTAERRLDFLNRHSPRVAGVRPCGASVNCAWTREITEDMAAPSAFGDVDHWRLVTAPRAQRALDYVRELVAGSLIDRPCPVQPRTWGGPGDVAQALARGLYPIGCDGTLNDGFAFWSAFRVPDVGSFEW